MGRHLLDGAGHGPVGQPLQVPRRRAWYQQLRGLDTDILSEKLRWLMQNDSVKGLNWGGAWDLAQKEALFECIAWDTRAFSALVFKSNLLSCPAAGSRRFCQTDSDHSKDRSVHLCHRPLNLLGRLHFTDGSRMASGAFGPPFLKSTTKPSSARSRVN